MDENRRELIRERQKEQGEKDKKKDYFSTITIVQMVLCLILIIAVIIISRFGGDNKQKLRNDFSRLMSWSIVPNNGADAINTLKEFLNEPFELMPAFSPVSPAEELTESNPDEETKSSLGKEETKPGEEIESENQEEDTQKSDLNEALSETEEQTENASENMGGVDIELYKAAEGTSFSPVATTSEIVRPVLSEKYTSFFGYRINPITNQKSFHTGLDIAAPLGTKIRAAYNGTVRKTGEDSHSGKYVILSHDDGFETFYCHCSKILAEQGAVIRAGETIALVGSTGWSTGPHLHFEVRKNGERLNPLEILEDDD